MGVVIRIKPHLPRPVGLRAGEHPPPREAS